MSDDKHSGGNFFTGLLFGAVAGAAGYFFLKTDEGKKARVRLLEEWEKAKVEMSESGVIQDVTKSLPETVQHTIEHIVEPQKMRTTMPRKLKVKKVATAQTEKNREVKKFKGV